MSDMIPKEPQTLPTFQASPTGSNSPATSADLVLACSSGLTAVLVFRSNRRIGPLRFKVRRRVGPQRAEDFGLRAQVEMTEACKPPATAERDESLPAR